MDTTGASIWIVLLIVAAAGAIGGAVNAYLTDNGFVFPKHETLDGTVIIRPGFVGSMSIGAVAAVASWGLYGPFASATIIGGPPIPADAGPSLAMSGFVGALLVGAGGGRWLTDHVDKQMLKATAVRAATTKDAGASAQIAIARPAQALKVARSL
jgi:hypothetical protein